MNTTKFLLLTAVALLLEANVGHAQVNFTKIPINTGASFGGCAWVDFNNDGYQDLLVANGVASASGGKNILYQNNGDGTFTQVLTGSLTTDVGYSLSVACGDYDNDGFVDLFFGGYAAPTPTTQSLLYHNASNSNSQRITSGLLGTVNGNFTAVWGDYDNDGFLDMFLASTGTANRLYHGNGDGTFSNVTSAVTMPHTTGNGGATGGAWADYDNDGYLDLFVYGDGGHNFLYHNNANGTFTLVTGAPFDTDLAQTLGVAWGDYDNDGYLDLFVVNGNFDTGNYRNYLYHNNGNGTFTKITTGAIVTDGGSSITAAWEDFDNDGYLDLLVSHNAGEGSGHLQNNALYHNNGDGTFTRTTNSLVADAGYSAGVAWADYDNDGFPDAFVTDSPTSYIFHNQGNTNNWISFKLVGTRSNRSAIGAKVRVQATIQGKTSWQMRQVSNADGLACNSLNPHFGLGDATNVQTIRIEWPSGTMQEFHNVPAKQFLTVTEPSQVMASATNGVAQLSLHGGRNLQYDIQTSTDLKAWSVVATAMITNVNGTTQITDTNAQVSTARFYRAVLH